MSRSLEKTERRGTSRNKSQQAVLCQNNPEQPGAIQKQHRLRSSHTETLTQVFSCKFCEVSKNTFFGTPPVAAFADLYLDMHFYLSP